MNDIALPEPLVSEQTSIVTWAKGLQIATPQDCQTVGDRLRGIKALAKQITDFFAPLKQKTRAAWQEVVDAEKDQLAPLQEAEQLAKRAVLGYQQAEEQKRLAEQQRLQAEADERARREQEALMKKAQAAKKPETQERYQQAAAQVVAPVVQVQSQAPKLAGLTGRKIWKARVVNHDLVPREWMLVNEKALDAHAKAMGPQAKVPGVEFYQEQQLAVSAR